MELLLKAPLQAFNQLAYFWARYFTETPTCATDGCQSIAVDVDPYFPYLDDLNRCTLHRRSNYGQPVEGSVS